MTEGAHVSSLLQVLLDDDDLRSTARPRLCTAPVRPGQMGAASQWIELVAGTGLDLAALLVSVGAWLRPREARGTGDGSVTVVIETNGKKLTLSSADPDEITQVLQALAEQRHRDPDDA
jgi:hypothetical protein